MKDQIISFRRNSIRINLLVIYFVLCFVPVVIDTISINYSFILLPLGVILYKLCVKRPTKLITINILLLTLIFLIATIYQVEFIEYSARRFASYVVFMSFVVYSLIAVNEKMVFSFRKAIVATSVIFSLLSIAKYFYFQYQGPINYELKQLIGTQRIGFISIMAVWILIFNIKKDDYMNQIFSRKYGFLYLSVVLVGLFLTFSRASIVALGISFILYSINILYKYFKNKRIHKTSTLYFILLIVIMCLLGNYIFPISFNFFKVTLIYPILDMSLFKSVNIEGSSEGIRLYRIREVINYVSMNPFTGTGYLGIWSISESGSGSAHNQYFDTLLRIGILGFCYFTYLLIKLMLLLKKIDHSLFWGMVGVLFYGLFHETFKESQGAFILSFMVGLYSQYNRRILFRSKVLQT